MPARARAGRQIALELPPELLERLRDHAAVRGATVANLVRKWIEAGLSGALESTGDGSTLLEVLTRLEALEAAVAALQSAPPDDHEPCLDAPRTD